MPSTAIFTIVKAEMLYNAKRVAPYALAVLFSLNALLWWRSGPATMYGWATNSDFYIVRCLGGFVFLTTPFFTAMMMGDPVLRDFRLEIDPLLLTAPIRRVEYLLGKFLGNFFTLALCFACFALMLFLLQAFRVEGMIVLPWRALPYLKHFFTIVVLTHLLIAAFCFTIGTLTRSIKFVYGAVMAGYVFLIFFGYFVTRYAPTWASWTVLTAPVSNIGAWPRAEIVNQYVIVYGTDFIVNRIGIVALATLLFLLLVWRFTNSNANRQAAINNHIFSLATQTERLYQETEIAAEFAVPLERIASRQPVAIPAAAISHRGFRTRWMQFAVSVQVEFRLLRHERSLIILAPLVVLFASVELGAAGNSTSYATDSARALLLLLFVITFFYLGEVLHRDQELGVEPVLWSTPVPDWILLLAKLAALLTLAVALMSLVLLLALVLQAIRGHVPISPLPYLAVYGIILLPSLVFIAGATLTLHVLLGNKYLAHIVGLGLSGGLIWLFLQGHVHWLYNPVLYQLWTYEDLAQPGPQRNLLLLHRLYWLAITTACLALAHWFYPRAATQERKRMRLTAGTAIILSLALGYWLKANTG